MAKGTFTEAASIDVGDHITAVWKVGDVEHRRTGRVARIIRGHHTRSLSFITKDGNEIVQWVPGSRVKFIMNIKSPAPQTALW